MYCYQKTINDYLQSAAHLTLLEHGVYNRLLDVYYTTEKPIKDKDKYRCIGANSPAEKKAVDVVLEDFFERAGDVWRQKRCDEEIEKYQKIVERNRDNGAKGGRPRGGNVYRF